MFAIELLCIHHITYITSMYCPYTFDVLSMFGRSYNFYVLSVDFLQHPHISYIKVHVIYRNSNNGILRMLAFFINILESLKCNLFGSLYGKQIERLRLAHIRYMSHP